uniref:Beta-galactosidase n=1 Tax=Parastrongyloides trichosuri TaxID=131310 RepID=A0A0N4ZFB1_PARTI
MFIKKINLLIFFIILHLTSGYKSFVADYDKHEFMLDGKPFRYISGEFHYFRVPSIYWRDRLKKIRGLGLNAIQVYIPWNYHNPYEDGYLFDGEYDFVQFIKMAQEEDLFVLLRAGPYICAEWENGGLPWWLSLRNRSIVMRSSDPQYIEYLAKWWKILMEKIKPLLLKNGGPILMVQIENEYGSYFACDKNYLAYLRDETWSALGKDVQLYTTDGINSNMLKCGCVDGVLCTVDFGVRPSFDDVKKLFELQNNFTNGGPKVNSEYYVGWFISWGKRKYTFPSNERVVETLKWIWENGGNVNLYPATGGTSFGFSTGTIYDGTIVSTSYDFNAAISENGDINDKYYQIQKFIGSLKDWKWKPKTGFKNYTRYAYGKVPVRPLKDGIHYLRQICLKDKKPLTFEELHTPYGFIVYRVIVNNLNEISIPGLRDVGYVVVNKKYIGKLDKRNYTIKTNVTKKAFIEIYVENEGRCDYETFVDWKGIIDNNVTIDGKKPNEWESCWIGFNINEYYYSRNNSFNYLKLDGNYKVSGPTVLIGSFDANILADTYVVTKGFHKGIVVINGHNLGRYWNTMGPQETLYIPKSFLRLGTNEVLIFEVEASDNCSSKDDCFIEFVHDPIWKWDSFEIY